VGRPRFVDRRLIKAAAEMIEYSEGQSLRVPEISHLLGISERALRDGFRDHMGISPKQFILLRKLHQARRMFQQGASEAVAVTKVATDLGMWDVGRFSMRYRDLFGESPLKTLQRSR